MLRIVLLIGLFSGLSHAQDVTAALGQLFPNQNSFSDLDCARIKTIRIACKANTPASDQIQDPRTKTSFSINCSNARTLENDFCIKPEANICRSSFDEYKKKRDEMNAKCAEKVGSCESSHFVSCNDYFRDNGSDELDEDPDLQDFLSACPFYARDKYKTSKEDEKELTETLKEYEDAIRDLQKDSLDDSKDYNKELAELDKEALDLEKQAKEQISEMDETLEKVKQGNASELSKIKQEISQLTAQLQKAVNTDAVAVRSKTKEHQLNAGIKCYQVGLEAARAEAARLRQGTLSRKDLNGQISSGGAVGWLKVVANNAYNECMNGGPISGGMKLAKEHEQAELQRLQAQINVMSSGIKALQEEYKQASSTLPKETQRIMQKYMDSTSQLTQQAMLKKQEKSNLMMTTQKKNLQMQMQLSQLSQKQAEVSKRLAKAKKERSISEKIQSSSVGDEKGFSEARAAMAAFQSARKTASDACCEGATLKNPIDGIRDSICLGTPQTQKELSSGGSAIDE